MIAVADKSGKILQLYQQFRSRPDCAKVKELVASGEIGPVKFVTAHLNRGDWRYLRSMAGSSIMEDGIHELDALPA